MSIGSLIADVGELAGATYEYPVGGKYKVGDTDNGVDFESPTGAPLTLRAVGSGKIVNTQGAFPGGSIVLKLDHAVRGHSYVYYGHLDNAGKRVKVGQHVHAGDTIAVTSRRPPGAEGMPGHTEIGFARGASGVIQTGGPAGGRRNANAPQWGKDFAAFIHPLRKKTAGDDFLAGVTAAPDVAANAGGDLAKQVVEGIFGMIGTNGAKILLTAALMIAGVALAGFGLVKATGTEGAVKTVAKVAAVAA